MHTNIRASHLKIRVLKWLKVCIKTGQRNYYLYLSIISRPFLSSILFAKLSGKQSHCWETGSADIKESLDWNGVVAWLHIMMVRNSYLPKTRKKMILSQERFFNSCKNDYRPYFFKTSRKCKIFRRLIQSALA